MAFCTVVGCGFRRNKKPPEQLEYERDWGQTVRFFKVPIILVHQGDETKVLSADRRMKWLAALNKTDLFECSLEKKEAVCSKHFVSGVSAQSWDRHNVDWVPTLFLGHDQNLIAEPNLENWTTEYDEVKQEPKEEIFSDFFTEPNVDMKAGPSQNESSSGDTTGNCLMEIKTESDADEFVDVKPNFSNVIDIKTEPVCDGYDDDSGLSGMHTDYNDGMNIKTEPLSEGYNDSAFSCKESDFKDDIRIKTEPGSIEYDNTAMSHMQIDSDVSVKTEPASEQSNPNTESCVDFPEVYSDYDCVESACYESEDDKSMIASLHVHYQQHNTENDTKPENCQEENEIEATEDPKPYACYICGKDFELIEEFKEHYKIHKVYRKKSTQNKLGCSSNTIRLTSDLTSKKLKTVLNKPISLKNTTAPLHRMNSNKLKAVANIALENTPCEKVSDTLQGNIPSSESVIHIPPSLIKRHFPRHKVTIPRNKSSGKKFAEVKMGHFVCSICDEDFDDFIEFNKHFSSHNVSTTKTF